MFTLNHESTRIVFPLLISGFEHLYNHVFLSKPLVKVTTKEILTLIWCIKCLLQVVHLLYHCEGILNMAQLFGLILCRRLLPKCLIDFFSSFIELVYAD